MLRSGEKNSKVPSQIVKWSRNCRSY